MPFLLHHSPSSHVSFLLSSPKQINKRSLFSQKKVRKKEIECRKYQSPKIQSQKSSCKQLAKCISVGAYSNMFFGRDEIWRKSDYKRRIIFFRKKICCLLLGFSLLIRLWMAKPLSMVVGLPVAAARLRKSRCWECLLKDGWLLTKTE